MKKQKLSLEELKVESFVLNIEEEKQTVVGGNSTTTVASIPPPNTSTIAQTLI